MLSSTNSRLTTSLRPYQQRAVDKARPYDGFAFISEQRTGKTVIFFAIAEEKKPSAILVVAPGGKPIEEWHRQYRKIVRDPDTWIDTYIVSFENFRRDRKRWRRWAAKQESLMMVVDESHRVKKRGGKWSKAVRSVGKKARYRYALTGTPIAQGIQDAWALFDYLYPGLFGTYAEFEEKYLKVVTIKANGKEWKKHKGVKDGMLPVFNRIYHKYTFRITLNEARREAGRKGIKTRRVRIPVILEPRTRKQYDILEEELETEIGERLVVANQRLDVIMKLQQICGGHVKTYEGDWIRVGTEKQRELRKILLTESRKVVVVCRFIEEIKDIKWMVENTTQKTVLILRGGTKYSGEMVEDVCIIQIQAGISIDLSMANVIIFYSGDYSYIDFEQIRYRIRSYDTNQVTEYFLICTDTVDELIFEAVRSKKDFAELVNDHYRRRYDERRFASTTG
jgi:SNF2 family DNA or RNA helicase